MPEPVAALLGPWSNFYVMTASAAAALTGLMFVVITLVSGTERLRRAPGGVSAFSTPTVVHFCAALLISATLIAPWRSLLGPAVVLGLAGLCGIAYLSRVISITKRLTDYEADIEDWVWYTLLPFVTYTAIVAGAIALPPFAINALFVLGAGVALLIFIGIRNAWDIVTYIAIGTPKDPP
jgi:hypothetical protein